jgi:hypothetical protein
MTGTQLSICCGCPESLSNFTKWFRDYNRWISALVIYTFRKPGAEHVMPRANSPFFPSSYSYFLPTLWPQALARGGGNRSFKLIFSTVSKYPHVSGLLCSSAGWAILMSSQTTSLCHLPCFTTDSLEMTSSSLLGILWFEPGQVHI